MIPGRRDLLVRRRLALTISASQGRVSAGLCAASPTRDDDAGGLRFIFVCDASHRRRYPYITARLHGRSCLFDISLPVAGAFRSRHVPLRFGACRLPLLVCRHQPEREEIYCPASRTCRWRLALAYRYARYLESLPSTCLAKRFSPLSPPDARLAIARFDDWRPGDLIYVAKTMAGTPRVEPCRSTFCSRMRACRASPDAARRARYAGCGSLLWRYARTAPPGQG